MTFGDRCKNSPHTRRLLSTGVHTAGTDHIPECVLQQLPPLPLRQAPRPPFRAAQSKGIAVEAAILCDNAARASHQCTGQDAARGDRNMRPQFCRKTRNNSNCYNLITPA